MLSSLEVEEVVESVEEAVAGFSPDVVEEDDEDEEASFSALVSFGLEESQKSGDDLDPNQRWIPNAAGALGKITGLITVLRRIKDISLY